MDNEKFHIYFCGDLIDETNNYYAKNSEGQHYLKYRKKNLGAAGNILRNFLTVHDALDYRNNLHIITPYCIPYMDVFYNEDSIINHSNSYGGFLYYVYFGENTGVKETRVYDYYEGNPEPFVITKGKEFLGVESSFASKAKIRKRNVVFVVEQHFNNYRALRYLFKHLLNDVSECLIFMDVRSSSFFFDNKDVIDFDFFRRNKVFIKTNEYVLHPILDPYDKSAYLSYIIKTFASGYASIRHPAIPDEIMGIPETKKLIPSIYENIKTVQTIGCGDSFYSAFIYKYLSYLSDDLLKELTPLQLRECLIEGSITGTYSATQPLVCHTNFYDAYDALLKTKKEEK